MNTIVNSGTAPSARLKQPARGKLVLLLALCAAAVVAVVAPATAGAFNVADFSMTNSNLQASGHPDVSISLKRQGSESEDLKDIRLDLPTGVFANPSAPSTCSTADFQRDACPAGSNVGAVQVGVKALGLLDMTINGTVDVITPEAGQTATMGLSLRPDSICILFIFCAQPQKIFLKTGVTVKTYEDSGLRTYTPGSPRTAVIGIPLVFVTPTITGDITINSMKLSFQSRAGTPTTKRVCGGFLNLSCSDVPVPPTGAYFWRQAGNCDVDAVASVQLVSYQGATSSATSSYRPTGCGLVPFRPTLSVTPQDPTGGKPTPLTFVLNIPEDDAAIQDSLPKIVDMDMPNGSGLNLDALDGVTPCSEDQLKASACPASSQIGTTYSFSKYIPGPNAATPGLSGKVFAMGVGNQFPIGVELKDTRQATTIIFRGTMGTRGDANAGTGRVYATFDKVPQVPYTVLSLTITRPVYKNPPVCGPAVASGKLTGFSGEVVNRTGTYTVNPCDAAPNTTITDGPPTVTSDRTPTFTFSSTIAGSAFQCKVDAAGTYAPCSSPLTTEPLTSGDHVFFVKAINGATEDPTPAQYAFNIDTSNFVVTPSITVANTQAVSHPDVDANFTFTGGQPRSVSLRLPSGMAASLSARPLCSLADAQAGTCDEASSIGTGTLTVETFGGVVETGVGEGYLSDGPGSDDAAGVALKVHFSFGDLIVVGGAFLVNNGGNQYIVLRDIPQNVGTTQFSAKSLTVNFKGSVNKLLTTPSSCAGGLSWVSTGTSWDGQESELFNVPFQATGCNTVPFNPQITQTLTNPNAGQLTGVVADVTLDPDNSSIKTMRVTEPPSLAPNYSAFGQTADQCPASAAPTPSAVFDPTVCPAQAKVGTMTLNTPLLPTPLQGSVYLIDRSPLPWMGVVFDQPGIHVRLTGVTSTPQVDPSCDPLTSELGYCQTQISVLFNNVPDVQISSIHFVLDGPDRQGVLNTLSGKILKVAAPNDSSCLTGPARAVFSPFTGTPAITRNQPITIQGCPA